MRPYNDSIFDLRKSYSNIFHEEKFKDIIDDVNTVGDSTKVFKISYRMSILSSLEMYAVKNDDGTISHVNEDISLMSLFCESEELDVFDSYNLQQLINYKWTKFAQMLHMRGCIAHFLYLFIMILYINVIYIENN